MSIERELTSMVVMVCDLRPLLRLGSCTHTLVAMSQKSTLVALPSVGSQ